MGSKTKEEQFLMTLYEQTLQPEGDCLPANKYAIGQKLSIHKKATESICNLLAQANFIKKIGSDEIKLTKNGIQLVEKWLK